MSLVQAIDQAIAYVRGNPDQMTRDQVEEFRRLADAVYVPAVRAGLIGSLPQQAELRPQLESNELRLPQAQFETKLNLPGDWDSVPSSDSSDDLLPVPSLHDDLPQVEGSRLFLVCASPRWLHDMSALRAVAVVALASKAESEGRPNQQGRRRGTGKARRAAAPKSMPAAAKDTSADQPKPEPIPVIVKGWSLEALDDLGRLARPATPSVALTDGDRYILTVLDAHRGKALTYRMIANKSVEMNLDNPKRIKRLSDSKIRQRVPVLESRGLVERPLGTKKQGISITDAGHQALLVANGNPTQTERKN